MIFRAIRFFGHHVLRTDTRIGRKVGAKIAAKGPPLIRRKEADFAAVGVERVERVAGVQDGRPLLEDGRVLDVANVVWCTGFRTDFSWIDLPPSIPTVGRCTSAASSTRYRACTSPG